MLKDPLLNDPSKVRRQGTVAIFACLFLIGLVVAVGVFLAASIGQHRVDVSDQDTASLFGRTFVTLAFFALAGVVGIANGVVMMRTGTRNRTIVMIFIGTVVAAFGSLIFSL